MFLFLSLVPIIAQLPNNHKLTKPKSQKAKKTKKHSWVWGVNYEGWSNKVGLGRLINQWQDGSCVAALVWAFGSVLGQQDGFRVGGSVGSEMGYWSCVVVEWAMARWVLPSWTLILSRLSVSLRIAYSLLYRSLSPLSLCLAFQFFIFYFTCFSVWTTRFAFFWICIFFFNNLYGLG